MDSTKFCRRTGLHKGLEDDWTLQRSGGGLDSTKVWRMTGLHNDLEEGWTSQRSGGGLDSTKAWRRTGRHIGLEEDWTPQRSRGGLDSTKIWRRTEACSLFLFMQDYFTFYNLSLALCRSPLFSLFFLCVTWPMLQRIPPRTAE